MDDLDLIVKAQDKEFWNIPAEELKSMIKRDLEETATCCGCEDYRRWKNEEESDGNKDN